MAYCPNIIRLRVSEPTVGSNPTEPANLLLGTNSSNLLAISVASFPLSTPEGIPFVRHRYTLDLNIALQSMMVKSDDVV